MTLFNALNGRFGERRLIASGRLSLLRRAQGMRDALRCRALVGQQQSLDERPTIYDNRSFPPMPSST